LSAGPDSAKAAACVAFVIGAETQGHPSRTRSLADWTAGHSDAIHGVADLDADALRRDIYDGTEPHILVEVSELREPEGRLLVVRIPPGMPPHTTSDGVARIRVGKESKPLTGSNLANLVVSRGRRDLTAEILPDVRFSDLDPQQFDRLRRLVRADPARSDLAELENRKLAEALGLASRRGVTLAAVLLLGSRSSLSRSVPRHELVFSRSRGPTRYDVRRDLRAPLLETLEEVRRLLTANLRVMPIGPAGFHQLEIPDITWWIAREAVLNALVHRDYFLHQSIHLRATRPTSPTSSWSCPHGHTPTLPDSFRTFEAEVKNSGSTS